MRDYLATLHQRPDHHKRRFALLTSGVITLTIFGVWSLVTFGGGQTTLAEVPVAHTAEISPFQSLWSEVAGSFGSLRHNLDNLKQGLEVVNSQADSPNINANTR